MHRGCGHGVSHAGGRGRKGHEAVITREVASEYTGPLSVGWEGVSQDGRMLRVVVVGAGLDGAGWKWAETGLLRLSKWGARLSDR